MIKKEEMAALILGGPQLVQQAIDERKKLMGDMVGDALPLHPRG